MREITELWAWVVTDVDGDEGVLRRKTSEGTQPLIADSRDRLEALADHAREMAQGMELPLKAVQFVRAKGSDAN